MTDQKYFFTHLKSKKFTTLNDKLCQSYLNKWGLANGLKLATFSFNEPFQLYQKNDLVNNFFSDQVVLFELNNMLPGCPLTKERIDSIDVEFVPCTIMTMEFFNKIKSPENKITRRTVNEQTHLQHCVDDIINGFMISDELRRMLIDEESLNYGLYVEKERDEFIFRLFLHLALGGRICQYEDILEPYINMTRQLYKDLITVRRNPETKEIQIMSHVFKVNVLGKEKKVIFPSTEESCQNFLYVIVSPVVRQIIVVVHELGNNY